MEHVLHGTSSLLQSRAKIVWQSTLMDHHCYLKVLFLFYVIHHQLCHCSKSMYDNHAMQSVVSTINNIIHCHDITNILINFAVLQSKWNMHTLQILMHTSIADSLQPTPDITSLHLRVRRRLPFKPRHAQANFCQFTIKDWVHVLLAVVNTRKTKQLLRSLSYNHYYYIKAAKIKLFRALKQRNYTISSLTYTFLRLTTSLIMSLFKVDILSDHAMQSVASTVRRQTKQLLRSVLSNQYYYIKAAYNKTVLRALKQRSYTIRPVTVIVHICKPVYFTTTFCTYMITYKYSVL